MNSTNASILDAPAGEYPPDALPPINPALPSAISPDRTSRLRYPLLAGILILVAWIAFTTLDSIHEITTDLDRINTRLSQPLVTPS